MERTITYDRQSRDFACYIDGILIGFAGSYHAGEVLCDQYVFNELARAEPVIVSRDEAHREERWERIVNQIAGLPEPEQAEAVRFTSYVIERLLAQHPATTAIAA